MVLPESATTSSETTRFYVVHKVLTIRPASSSIRALHVYDFDNTRRSPVLVDLHDTNVSQFSVVPFQINEYGVDPRQASFKLRRFSSMEAGGTTSRCWKRPVTGLKRKSHEHGKDGGTRT